MNPFNHPLLIIIGFLPLTFAALWSKFEGVGTIGIEKQAPKIANFCKKWFFRSLALALFVFFLDKGLEYSGIYSFFFYLSIALIITFLVLSKKFKMTPSKYSNIIPDWQQLILLRLPMGYLTFFLMYNLFVT